MEIASWVIWIALVFLAISLSLGCLVNLKNGKGFQRATGIQALSFWILAVSFLFFEWNKFHIIWLAPLVFVSAQIIAVGLSQSENNK